MHFGACLFRSYWKWTGICEIYLKNKSFIKEEKLHYGKPDMVNVLILNIIKSLDTHLLTKKKKKLNNKK